MAPLRGVRVMLKAIRHTVVCALVFLPGLLIAGEHFDGNWLTKLTCPAKGSTEGYTWQFPSVIHNGNFHGERGTAGEPGYCTLDGAIKGDGTAKTDRQRHRRLQAICARSPRSQDGALWKYQLRRQGRKFAGFNEKETAGFRDAGLAVSPATTVSEAPLPSNRVKSRAFSIRRESSNSPQWPPPSKCSPGSIPLFLCL